MSWLIHLANGLVLLSFLARDILWLRALSILAGICFTGFYLTMPEPIWEGVAWNAVFMAINAVQIGRIVAERRPVQLSEPEARLRQILFTNLAPRDLQRLVAAGEWREHGPEDRLIARGQAGTELMIVYAGRAGVEVDGERVAELRPGRFVGEMSWVTGEAPNADVVALEPLRCLCWEQAALREFLEAHPAIRQALQVVVGQDLARKLRA